MNYIYFVRLNSSLYKGLWGGSILFLSAASLLPAQTSTTSVISKLHASTVTVNTYNPEGKLLATGCGFFTSNLGDVITCRHVIKDASRVSIQTQGGRAYRISEVIAEDPQADLIRLRADIPPDVAEVLATTPVPAEKGDGILVIGPDAEDGSGRKVLSGEISAVRDIYGFGTIVEISAPLTPGYSGSPVVNMEGDVIGVATFQVIGENKVNFAVPSERVSRLLPKTGKTVAEWDAERRKNVSDIKEELYLTGLGLLWAREWESALYCLKGVVDEDPLYLIAYPWIGFCSLQLGLWEDAVDAYRQTLLIRAEDATAYSHLGIAYGKLNRWGEAVAAYRQAARLEPEVPVHYINLGFTYTKIGDWEKALENFSQAAALDAGSDEAHYGMGLAYWVLEEDAKAWVEYRTLKKLGSSLAAELYEYLSR